MTIRADSSRWQIGDCVQHEATNRSGKIAKEIRTSPVIPPSLIIACDQGGVTAGLQSALEAQGWTRI